MPASVGFFFMSRRAIKTLITGGALIGLFLTFLTLWRRPPSPEPIAAYAGSASCKTCHPAPFDAWKQSDHALALGWEKLGTPPFAPELSDGFIPGMGGNWFVESIGPGLRFHRDPPDSGKTGAWTHSAIGIDPIQQYIAPFPGGRYQVLPLAYDTMKKEWFDLTGAPEAFAGPAEPAPWDSREAAANTACLFCHTTGYDKGYDIARDAYESRWREAGVSCETCHGPALEHVRWQEAARRRTAPKPKNSKDPFSASLRQTGKPLMETCASCHARRMELDGKFRPGDSFHDHFILSLLETEIYHADGQIRGEVYEYASFLQSKMHAKGITCHDCHDPHTSRPRASGNALCLTCHEPHFAAPAHTLHAAGSPGSLCVSCHMPVTTFMKRDPRRDHSFSLPEPELTIRYGLPNACNSCHADKSPAWASERLRAAFGPADAGVLARAGAIEAARRGDPAAVPELLCRIQDPEEPAVWRATQALLLAAWTDRPEVARAVKTLLGDPDPLARMAATRALGRSVRPETLSALAARLADSHRAVRHEAAGALAPHAARLSGRDRDAFEKARAEYAETNLYHADQPIGRYNLGLLHEALEETPEARTRYEEALSLDPAFTPASVNLGMLLARLGDLHGAEGAFRRAAAANPRSAAVLFNLGLLYAGARRFPEAAQTLEEAVRIDPTFPRARYNLALALAETQQLDRASEILSALIAEESTPEHLWALATLHLRRGDVAMAREVAHRILAIDPAHAGALELLEKSGR